LCIYSAVARIPVALALLVFNLFPVLFMLINWAMGGARPRNAALALIGIILFGLILVLNVPSALAGAPWTPTFAAGVAFGLGAAVSFATVLWMTERKLNSIAGPTRTLALQAIVFALVGLLAATGALPESAMAFPREAKGWWAIALVAVIYGTAFSTLFVLMPRLDMARNAPALNVEPVATLFMGWAILGQTLQGIQWLGAAIVVSAIIGLSTLKK
jgi:drug/metabolite transporter (DMT)-like permease